MGNGRPPYHERFLHWIWGSLHFDLNRLKSVCGKPITVLDPGELNSTDGPDFKGASIQIGNLKWYGDVEIHWSAGGWTDHGHHLDARYNRVILHVVYERPGPKPKIRRKDDTTPYTLHLRPYLPPALHELIDRFHRKDRLPCTGTLHYISKEAFASQLEDAHRQYFEVKADTLLTLFYAPELPPSLAWKRLLALGLFDGLGISHNREPMRVLGRELFDRRESVSSPAEFKRLAEQLAGFAQSGPSQHLHLRWNRKGCRPASHPEVRVPQAAALMWHVLEIPLEWWFGNSSDELWSELAGLAAASPGVGRERAGILYGVVLLPSLYLLGSLFHSESLRQQALERWNSYTTGIPQSLFRLYKNSGIPSDLYKDKLGAVYQLNHYCRSRRCQDCRVLKHAISS